MFWGVNDFVYGLVIRYPIALIALIALAYPVKFKPWSQGSLPRQEREPWGLVHHVKPTATKCYRNTMVSGTILMP